MAANDNIVVKIVGDASGVQPAVEQTVGSFGQLEPLLAELNANMKAFTGQMVAGFTSGAAGAKKLAVGLEETNVAASRAGSSLGNMSERLHFGGLSFGLFEKAIGPLVAGMAALFAVDKIAGWISKMAEASEQVMHLSQQFGTSTAQVQQLQGVATATGIPVESLTRGMGFLDRNLANAAGGSKRLQAAMEQVGISFNDGRTQMEKLAVVADKFKNMDDGPKKVALAMQLFGRSGRELIPVLNLGSAGIEQLNQKMAEYGVVNDDAVAKGAVLAENVNETKLGFSGIGNVLTQALAPAFTELVAGINEMIKAFIESYRQGGAVAVIMGIIAGAIKIAVAVVEDLGQIFAAVWDVISSVVGSIIQAVTEAFGISLPKNVKQADAALNVFKDVLTIVKDAVIIAVDVIGAAFRVLMQTVITFAKVAWDALNLNWGAIEGDWQRGMGRITQIVQDEAGKIRAAAAEMGQAIAAAAQGKALGPDLSGIKLPKAGGDFDYDPSKGAKEKKPKDDLVQKLEEELQAKKNAWNEEQVAQDTAQEFSLQSEAAFWNQALARTDLSAKDRVAIKQKYIAAEMGIQKEAFDQQIELDKEAATRAGQNAALKLQALQKEAADFRAHYGAQSKEAIDANKAVVEAERNAATQLRQIHDQEAENYRQSQLAAINIAEANARFEVEMGRMSATQLLQLERQYENQRYAIEAAALQRRLQLMQKDPSINPVELKKLQGQIQQLWQQHEAKLTQIDQQAVAQRTAIERGGINQFASSWASALAKMATLQASFSDTLKSLWQGIQQAIGSVIEQILEQFIAAEVTKLIFGKTSGEATIATAAAEAGARGVASFAGAPWPIDMGAPAFGASMSAAAMAFSGLNAFDVGAWDLSKDQMGVVHQGEMIIPANLAGGMRNLFQAVGNDNYRPPVNDVGLGGGLGSGGDVHLHLHSVIPPDRREIEQFLLENHRGVGKAVRKYVRQNGDTRR